MLFGDAPAIVIDLASAGVIASGIAGAIIAHGKLIVTYLREQADRASKQLEKIMEDHKLTNERLWSEVVASRNEARQAMRDAWDHEADVRPHGPGE